MEIDSKVSAIYMRTLAEYAIKCHSDDIVLGTDKVKSQYEIYSHSTPRSNSACFSLVLNNCSPQPTMDVGIEQLLDFKEKRKQNFLQFRQTLRNYEIDLSHCSSEEETRFKTEEFKESWQREIMQAKNVKRRSYFLRFGSLCTLVSAPSIACALEPLIHIQGLRVLWHHMSY